MTPSVNHNIRLPLCGNHCSNQKVKKVYHESTTKVSSIICIVYENALSLQSSSVECFGVFSGLPPGQFVGGSLR